jgi:hypothetical protein
MTNAKVLFGLSVILLIGVGLYFFGLSWRYTVVAQPGEDGNVYEVDRQTGRLWWVLPGTAVEIPRKPLNPVSQPPSETAISLAGSHLMNGSADTADTTIHNWLEAHKGILRLYGWNATKIEDQTYLVVYTFDEGPGSNRGGWAFEVNLAANIVRPLADDPALEKKYPAWAQPPGKP